MADLRMPDINNVQLAGRLTRDPELKRLPSGTAVCEISIAVSRRYKTQSGEQKEETAFVEVSIWDRQGEWLSEALKKGSPVLVDGNLKMDSWEDRQTGQKRSKLTVRARRVQPLDWGDSGRSGGGGSGGGSGGYSGGGDSGGGRDQSSNYEDDPAPEDDIPF